MPFKINDDEFDEIINTVSDYYHSLKVFDIEIDAELVVVENFETKEAIINMLKNIL